MQVSSLRLPLLRNLLFGAFSLAEARVNPADRYSQPFSYFRSTEPLFSQLERAVTLFRISFHISCRLNCRVRPSCRSTTF